MPKIHNYDTCSALYHGLKGHVDKCEFREEEQVTYESSDFPQEQEHGFQCDCCGTLFVIKMDQIKEAGENCPAGVVKALTTSEGRCRLAKRVAGEKLTIAEIIEEGFTHTVTGVKKSGKRTYIVMKVFANKEVIGEFKVESDWELYPLLHELYGQVNGKPKKGKRRK